MRTVDWVFAVAFVIAFVVVLFRARSNRGLVVLGAALATQSISKLIGDTPVGIALFVTAFVLLIWAGVLMFRQTRAQWRKDMERVKHL